MKLMQKRSSEMREILYVGKTAKRRIVSSADFGFLKEYGIMMFGLSDVGPDLRIVRHVPKMSQALVCLGGEGQVYIDGAFRSIQPGHAYLTPPKIFHAYRSVPRKRWQYLWLIYFGNAGDLTPFSVEEPVLMPCDPAPLKRVAEGMFEESISHGSEMALRSWLDLLRIEAARTCELQKRDSRLTKLLACLREDLARSWNLDAMSEIAGVNKETLRRAFAKAYGNTPLRYLTILRMRHAAHWLQLSDDTLETVAARVGYGDPFAFGVAFKREMGVSPGRFRKRHGV